MYFYCAPLFQSIQIAPTFPTMNETTSMSEIETKPSESQEKDAEMQREEQPDAISSEDALLESLSNQNDQERQKREAAQDNLPQAKEEAPTLLRSVLGNKDSQIEEEKKIDQEEANTEGEHITKKAEKKENQYTQRVSDEFKF